MFRKFINVSQADCVLGKKIRKSSMLERLSGGLAGP